MKYKIIAIFVLFLIPFITMGNDPVTRGDAHFSRNELNEAIYFYSLAIQERPNSAVLYYKRARAYVFANKYQEYLEDVQKALVIDPELPSKLPDSLLLEHRDKRSEFSE